MEGGGVVMSDPRHQQSAGAEITVNAPATSSPLAIRFRYFDALLFADYSSHENVVNFEGGAPRSPTPPR